jgi:DNA-binding NtrC family response regulator
MERAAQERWLVSWIGNTDHECAEGHRSDEVGPIATALQAGPHYQRVHLLTNYPHERSLAYCRWLERLVGREVDLYQIELDSPIDYGAIYRAVSAELTSARLPREDVELTFHLSPGTPAMAAIWIILARTRFPARLIQTSVQRGLEPVDFDFDLASDFLPEFLQRSSERIDRLADARPAAVPGFERVVYAGAAMRRQVDLARKVAVHDVPVLILGETGTGKELFAQAIHDCSRRAGGPFVAVNCGAIPAELASAELFGHRKGAFTGAATERKGHFREAEGGTLFLDEIGDLPPETQVRLLRALQAGEVTPLGESRPVKVDVRIVAATHRDLAADVAAGRFREDLFHRLAVGILHLPPLREREGDLALLIERFMAGINADARGQPEAQEKKLSSEARNILLSYAWPGNVRELYHTLLRATIWSAGAVVSGEEARAALVQVRPVQTAAPAMTLGQGVDLQGFLDDIARQHIERALQCSGGRKTQAAKLLGFPSYQTLGNWMRRLGVENGGSIDLVAAGMPLAEGGT